MTIKLSEIFIPLPDRDYYSAKELSALDLQPNFIQKIATLFDLSFIEGTNMEGNLCFAANKEVRPEYRNTFSKADILQVILPEMSGETVNLKQDEVAFPAEIHAFFSNSLKR